MGDPNDDMHRGKWWEIFGDPQLNALEEQIDINNQTLALEPKRSFAARARRSAWRAPNLYPTLSGGGSVGGAGTSGTVGAFANSAGAQTYAVI